MKKLLNDIDWIKLIESLNLKRAILSEADIDGKVASTSKMIVKIKNDDGSIKSKYAVYFISIWLWSKSEPSNFLSYETLLAILFHEFAHLRHMNHSLEFMVLLKHIYMFATENDLFQLGKKNET